MLPTSVGPCVRKLVSLALAVVFVTGVAAATRDTAMAQTADLIRVGSGPDDQATPLLYAAKAGIYKKYGLNVEIEKMTGAAAVAAALAGGSLEIAKGSSLGAITAIGRGLPFTVIGNLAYYDAEKPDVGLVVSSTSDIKTPKDLEGKTIGSISLQSLNSVGLFAWLNRNDVDISTLKYTEFSSSATLAAIERNQIAAAMLTEPFFSADVATGKVRVLAYPLGAIAKKFSNALLFTSTKWASAHPDLVAKFLRATQEASEYVAAHETESAHLVVEFGGLDPATVVNIRHATRGVALDPAHVQPVIDVAAKYNVIPKAFPAKDMFCSCALLQK